ncbi:MAG: hypothetical protein LBL49_07525 [Clostridiales Family XIII bacterium]|jgi:hypothetical protein|nr:hypothetical protein [Clostridiales Family XIII bacterium]
MRGKEKLKVAILASSNKRRHDDEYGCCVAGVTEEGEWIRLVADKCGDSIREKDAPKVGKVIAASFEYASFKNQIENAILIDFTPTTEDPKEYVKNIKPVHEDALFGNKRNFLTKLEIKHCEGSLRRVFVRDLEVYWNETSSCRARFTYQQEFYEGIAMTDPKHYTKKGSAPKRIGEAYIVVSLPSDPPYNKFIAAIYPITVGHT